MSQINFAKFGKNPKQTQLLAVLLLVLVAGGFIYWRYYSSNPPKAIDSSADGTRAHWSHSTLPFQLPIVNQASSNWRRPLALTIEKWGAAKVVNYKIVKGSTRQFCDMFAEGMKLCSYSAQDEWLALAVYVQGPTSEHILGGTVKLNDYYFFTRGSEYNTDAWRNNQLCHWLGWTLGVNFDFNQTKSDSCMNVYTNFDTVSYQQDPSMNDYNDLKTIYNHLDDTSSSSVAYKVDKANQLFSQGQFGSLTESYSGSGIEIYQTDLGDGYTMKTLIQKVSTK